MFFDDDMTATASDAGMQNEEEKHEEGMESEAPAEETHTEEAPSEM